MSAVWIDSEPAPLARAAKIERESHKLEKRLCRLVGQAIADYNMVEAGDKVMVCLSGGKDSYALLDILLKLRARAPVALDIVAVRRILWAESARWKEQNYQRLKRFGYRCDSF